MRVGLERAGRRRSAVRRSDGPWVPWLVAAVAAAVYSTFAVTQWRRLEVPSWDLGIFTQLAKAYSRLEAPVVTIKGAGFNLLGDHFHPLLVVLGPIYRLFPSGLTLLIVQALLLALSAVPLTAVARELLGPRRGAALGVAYAFSWGLQGAVAVQFHEIALAVPLLALSLAAFLRARWWACALWAAPLVLVKEDLGLTVAVLGLVIWWRSISAGRAAWPRRALQAVRGDRQAQVGAGLAAWGVVWFVLAIGVVLPALNPRGTYDYYDRVATEGRTGVLDLLLGALAPAEKWVTVLLLVLAAGVVGVRSPLVWLWVPTLAWRFVGEVEHYWGWEWHYSAVLMPVAAAALLDAVAGPPAARRTGRAPVTGPAGSGQLRAPAGRGGWASAAVALALATTVGMTVTTPVARLADPVTYQPSPRLDGARAAVDAVTPGSTVESDIYLMAYLVPRAQVYWVGNHGNPAPDYLVLDTQGRTWPDVTVTDAAALAESRHPGTTYVLVVDADGYQVAERAG
ncbi:putative membrane protein DUF2079 [Georgenia soli]|uniref:Putative membrane protein DUF2079 n=1 Tax=Georgenia soli TaxID=638953 RepID=A0A2A9EN09_9MICO|nr:DUF2079 domain-containing protein [Georgenia soli]PFG39996.1 putative membrane protein DUF2079 [Georgenia soli]